MTDTDNTPHMGDRIRTTRAIRRDGKHLSVIPEGTYGRLLGWLYDGTRCAVDLDTGDYVDVPPSWIRKVEEME